MKNKEFYSKLEVYAYISYKALSFHVEYLDKKDISIKLKVAYFIGHWFYEFVCGVVLLRLNKCYAQ